MRRLPAAQSHAILHAYRVGFAYSLDHLVVIAAVIAFVGSILSFWLVRQQDFVTSGGQRSGPDGQGDGGGSRVPAAPPSADGSGSVRVPSPA